MFEQAGRPELFQKTGVLFTPRTNDPRADATQQAFEKSVWRLNGSRRRNSRGGSRSFAFARNAWACWSPSPGRCWRGERCKRWLTEAVREGVEYRQETVLAHDRSETVVYACGPWLPKVFPEVLADRIRVTRQEVFFFGPPQGDASFTPPLMPVWADITDEHSAYTIPDIESRGFKLAFDRHGPQFDPDSDDRAVRGLDAARAFLAERFPRLTGAPLVESRVCQYENTSTGDFLIDRHPGFQNVWLVGGGSGHGFKHGPAVGEHVCALIEGRATVEPRFSLESKSRDPRRSVF